MNNANTIDLMKLFFAFCIVALHTELPSAMGDAGWFVSHLLFRLAVPFFFVTSGYFLGKNLNAAITLKEKTQVLKKYRSRLLPSFLFWSGLGLIILFVQMLIFSDASALKMVLLLARHVLFYPLNAMWYVGALIVSSVIIELFYRKTIENWLVPFSLAAYCFALVANNYNFAIEDTPVWGGKYVSKILCICA